MSEIKSATPLGFNIKTKDAIFFGGQKIMPPLCDNILFDIQENPYRWKVEYTEKGKSPAVKTMDTDVPPELALAGDLKLKPVKRRGRTKQKR